MVISEKLQAIVHSGSTEWMFWKFSQNSQAKQLWRSPDFSTVSDCKAGTL